MTVKVSVYIAVSLDGFIARKNGDIDWLTGGESGEDYGYADFMSTVDHVVMGRNTFEKVLSFGGWHYEKKVIVLTSRDLTLAPELSDKAEALHVSPRELIHELERRGVRHIYLDGGVTVQRFLREGLVDEMTITTIPILIGEGLPLFGALEEDVRLELLRSQAFKNGFVQNIYKVI
ncbi:MAG: dihydrofolate reductase family protein [Anaerolineales bacterium]|nr:dihydrofolate reductase family protein [Anaerolineales bacterium]